MTRGGETGADAGTGTATTSTAHISAGLIPA